MEKYSLSSCGKPVFFWIFVIVMIGGFFLRAYSFSDWMQFGPDQARNAMIVGSAIEGKEPIPTLGPLAAGSHFKLGAIFYQFQFFSAKIFGNNPAAMGLPDLFFGIIAIPCLFFLARRLFSANISIALASIFSVSYFFIIHSRFSSNPNATPLFVMLFILGVFEMTKNENFKKYQWPLLVGVGAGVGIQQHTILFLVMPVVALGWMIFLFIKKRLNFWSLVIIVVVIIIFNSGQILSEYRTGGANLKEFIISLNGRSSGGGESRIFRNTYLVSACQIQANINFVSSTGNIEQCGDIFKLQQKKKDNFYIVIRKNYRIISFAVLSSMFTILGYAVFIWRLMKERDKNKKMLLLVLMSFNLATLLIMIPVATEISLRYFIVLFFMPFIFLGLITEEILMKKRKYGNPVILLVLILLLILNIRMDVLAGVKYINKQVNDAENSIFGETELMAKFIIVNSCDSRRVYLDGQTDYVKRLFKPLKYLLLKSGIVLISLEDNPKIDDKSCIFYITKKERVNEKAQDKDVIIVKTEIFGGTAIHLLNKR